VWAGGSPAAALAGAGLPPATPVVSSHPSWPHPLPESLEAGHARYDQAIAAAAARAAVAEEERGDGGGECSAPTTTSTSTRPSLLLLISHGEAVRRAVTRLAPTSTVYEARHCGWVACEWRPGDGDDDGDPGEWALLAGASHGVAWID
jgi:hypothetical protein